jgi:hypothetical protein
LKNLIFFYKYRQNKIKVELEKTAEDFRKAHKERQELIKQWEIIIEQMQKRDTEIDGAAQVLNYKVARIFHVLSYDVFFP